MSLPIRCRLQFREGPDDHDQQHHNQQRGKRHEQQSDRQGKPDPATTAESAQREEADAARAAKIAALHDQISERVEQLTADPQWRAMHDAAAKFHAYSLNNQLLIMAQAARLSINPTRVAGFGTWKALGRSVVKGSTGLAVLAPRTYTPKDTRADTGTGQDARQAAPAATTAAGTAGEPAGGDADRPIGAWVLRGFRVAHVFDICQTEGDPLPGIVPELLTGDAPAALWEAPAAQAAGHDYTLVRAACGRPTASPTRPPAPCGSAQTSPTRRRSRPSPTNWPTSSAGTPPRDDYRGAAGGRRLKPSRSPTSSPPGPGWTPAPTPCPTSPPGRPGTPTSSAPRRDGDRRRPSHPRPPRRHREHRERRDGRRRRTGSAARRRPRPRHRLSGESAT